MNLKSLIAKMTAIEEGAQMAPPSGPEVPVEECGDEMMPGAVEECGDMPMPGIMAHSNPQQQDNVTMNVSMNGSGAGGIRDLMDILRNLENGDSSDEMDMPGDELIIGAPGDVGEIELPFADEAIDGGFGRSTTEPNAEIQDVDAVLPTGDDLASKGMMGRHGVSISGSNGLRETLVDRLSQHYQEVKGR
jgi:hypothetical protein